MARDYDPSVGRWTTKDGSRFGGGLNFYAYSDTDPVNLVDPTGFAPGTPYLTRDGAGLEAIRNTWFASIVYGREFSGSLYSQMTADGLRFFYTPATPSWEDPRVGIAHTEVLPKGGTRVGGYHTHPKGVDVALHCSGGDKKNATNAKMPEYLGNPNGDVRVFTPTFAPGALDGYSEWFLETNPAFGDRKIGNISVWWQSTQ